MRKIIFNDVYNKGEYETRTHKMGYLFQYPGGFVGTPPHTIPYGPGETWHLRLAGALKARKKHKGVGKITRLTGPDSSIELINV